MPAGLHGRVVLALLGSALAACGGGGSPTAPLIPTPAPSPPSGWSEGTVVTVVSGETDAPVAAARLLVAGVPHTTDGAGQAVVQAVGEGATVDVEADRFLARQTIVRHSATRLTLWPDDSRLPGEYTKTLVYTASTLGDSTSVVPLERIPPRVRNLALLPSDALAADPQAMSAHRQAADYFNVAVEGRTVFSVGGAADMTVNTRIDGADADCQGKTGRLMARTWVSSSEVTRAEIIFCGEDASRLPSPIAHELGHVFGLAHSRDDRDLMYPYYYSWDEHGFTERETLLMGLIYLRRGGNTWPDNDRSAATSASRVRLFVD